jgi:hypothetical protein
MQHQLLHMRRAVQGREFRKGIYKASFLLHRFQNYRSNVIIIIVMCRRVRVTKLTSSSSDDWIYWHFGYNLF